MNFLIWVSDLIQICNDNFHHQILSNLQGNFNILTVVHLELLGSYMGVHFNF